MSLATRAPGSVSRGAAIALAAAAALQWIAWMGLRHLGGPLRLGISGGVAAVSGSTLYVAANHWMTGRPTKILSSWPRDGIVLRRVSRLGMRRLLTVTFPGTEAPARLEILGRRKDDTIAGLFGRVA